MTEITDRASIIIFTQNPTDPTDYMILVGVSRYGITTIGGSKHQGEQEIKCCVRECYEKTRGLINFETGRSLLKQARTFKYDKCLYYIVPGLYDNLVEYCTEFREIVVEDIKPNELLEMRLVSANQLIKSFVMGNFTDETGKHVYTQKFVNMFMDLGFDKLTNNSNNHYTNGINMSATLRIPLCDLPPIVSVTLLKHNLPVIYGTLHEENQDKQYPPLYMSSQLYYETEDESVFRNYIIKDGDILFTNIVDQC